VRYYLEKRDPEFEPKMAEILCVYRQVAMLRARGEQGASQGPEPSGAESLAIISYDEKPGIQALGTTAPDRPPLPGTSPTVTRDHEYQRHGTLTLMAGIDLLTGQVHALVKERHRSREFIEFLKILDTADPDDTAIEVILDNHSAHVSRETTSWLAAQPIGRFTFTFTPKHGSWLNLIEGFFSKLARSVLRHIRVSSKHELKERRMAFIRDINREPIHTWHYQIDEAA
jgi:transposase